MALEQKIRGLAIDIDDTISATFLYFARKVNSEWKNPIGLSAEEIVKQYKIMPDVPFWQTPEIQEWLKIQSRSNTAQEEIEPVPGALEAIQKINAIAPVMMYITSRVDEVRPGTRRWLENNGFPQAELIMRPGEYEKLNGNVWKAAIVEKRFPEISGIVDDNPEIIKAFGDDYEGVVYLYGTQHEIHDATKAGIKVELCPTWNDVLKAVIRNTGLGD